MSVYTSMFSIIEYQIKSHISVTMQSWLFFVCWGTGCTGNYFMDTILDHSYLQTVSCFHHSWLNMRTDSLCVQRLSASAGSSSVAPPVFLPLATELEKSDDPCQLQLLTVAIEVAGVTFTTDQIPKTLQMSAPTKK